MSDGAIIPFSKKLGKLSILILEGYLRSKVGDGFVDELGEPYLKQEKLAKALQHTENRFVKLFDDKELAHAMFVDLKQSDRPILKEAILRFLDHPTDPDFPEALQEILTSEFSFLDAERINRAVITYLNLLTEEISLEDPDFREKMVALISIRGGNLWSSALSVQNNSNKDIIPRKVDIILEGDFQSFDRKKKSQFKKTISSLLDVDQKQIRILSVKPGSIILRVTLPGYAVFMLAKMILDESLDLRRAGVLSVKTKEDIFRFTKDLRITVIGEGSVGKTSLVRRLIEDTFSDSGIKTDGINIQQWRVKIEDERFKVHVWDFGGQEIMHGTHQFFLSKNALYLLVLDSRMTAEENRLEYWLETVKAFAGESPIIVVGNKTDQHVLEINKDDVMQRHPSVEDICEISCATGKGILELKFAIGKAIGKIPYAYLELSLPLFAVKHKIEQLQLNNNYIDYEEYKSLCESENVFDFDTQKEFANYLHEMGTVLYFRDNIRLEDVIILNPQWVTNGMYKILNSHALFQNKGVLSVSMLDEILNMPEYPLDKRLFIVDMMNKFELCFVIEIDKTFLIPDLLPKDEPAELKFNGISAFEYAYPVLPSSVITRFIVRMNQKIENHLVWRTGVVLKIGENTALVKADIEDRKITIAIDGLEHTRRDALSAIRYQLDEIHGSIKGLDTQKRVPIPEAPNAEPLDYDYLLQLERDGELEILPVKDGTRLVKVNVRKLLSGVVSKTERRQSAGNTTTIYIGGDVKGGTIIAGDENEVKK